jgi:hypothetical protein
MTVQYKGIVDAMEFDSSYKRTTRPFRLGHRQLDRRPAFMKEGQVRTGHSAGLACGDQVAREPVLASKWNCQRHPPRP